MGKWKSGLIWENRGIVIDNYGKAISKTIPNKGL
jgi:hypothetical protein